MDVCWQGAEPDQARLNAALQRPLVAERGQRLQPAFQTLWFAPRMRLKASSASGWKPPHLKQLMKPWRAEDRIAPPGGTHQPSGKRTAHSTCQRRTLPAPSCLNEMALTGFQLTSAV